MAQSRVRIPPSPLAQRPPRLCAHPRRGGRAVECGGLENRYPSLGGSRVQIPPPPPQERADRRRRAEEEAPARAESRSQDNGGGGGDLMEPSTDRPDAEAAEFIEQCHRAL